MDLVDEMEWEDHEDFLTLEDAGLENSDYDTIGASQKAYYKEEDANA